jgi:hypothetical protein
MWTVETERRLDEEPANIGLHHRFGQGLAAVGERSDKRSDLSLDPPSR